ncbi:MAG: hypothetical protein JNK63_01665 [Chthonomonas sp.]|nr:hypothetical protein [Chthonomonas sp.]
MIALILASQIALNYGQTAAMIDAKGMEGWIAFCEQKEGHDLPEYELRAQIYQYAEAVRTTNKTRIAKQPSSLQPYYTSLATELHNYSMQLVATEEALMGGGTMYILFYASASARSAEVIKALATAKFKAKRGYVVSDVTKALTTFDTAIAGADPDFSKPADAKTALASARVSYGKVAALLAKRPRAESDFVLEFCASRAKLETN